MLELAGIHDILSKSLGTQNPINLVKATVAGLRGLRTPEEVAKLRGLTINQVLGLGGEELAGEASTLEPEAQAASAEESPRRTEAPATRPPRPPRRPHRGAPCGGVGLMSMLSVTQRRSRNGANRKQLDTLRSLGLRRIGHTVEVKDSSPPGACCTPCAIWLRSRRASERSRGLWVAAHRAAHPGPRSRQPAPAQAGRTRRRLGHRQDRPAADRRAPARARARSGELASRAGRCRSTCACESCAGRT